MKHLRNRDYAIRSGYALAVILISILFVFLLFNLQDVSDALGVFLGILTPFIAAIIIAYVLNGLVRLMEERVLRRVAKQRTRRYLSIIIVYFVLLLAIAGLIWMVIPSLVSSVVTLVTNMPIYLQQMMQELSDMPFFQTNIGVQLFSLLTTLAKGMADFLNLSGDFLNTVLSTSISIASTIFSLLLGVILSIPLLASKERFLRQGKQVIFACMKKERAQRTLDRLSIVNQTFSRFLVGRLVECLALGACYLVVFTISGVTAPYTALISVILMIFNIIPFFGCIIGAVVGGLILLIVNPMGVLWYVLIVVILQVLDGNLLAPKILGNATGLSFWWVLFALLVGGGLFGVWGMLLGTPVFALIYYFFAEFVYKRLRKKGITVEE